MADIHAQVEELFDQASRLSREQRSAFLDQHCNGNSQLRAEIESLLAHFDASDQFLGKPPVALNSTDWKVISAVAGGPTGLTQIGSYRILDVLGEGGMGIVYRAEQDSPRRIVALKVIRSGVASPSALRRFARETKALGRLQHPGIAQIYEAGAFDSGHGAQPFFAMELVAGRPITDYAHDAGLNISQRLDLLIKVCQAVEHAHQQGVIHRDLKPGNILVADAFGEPQVKILDFGVARVIDSDVQITTLQTDIGQLIGTIPYMSPEQITGDPQAIDRRSDVYALGVLCYELLSGRRPHDLQDRAIPEAARIIREEDPAPLSSIDRNLRGDIETIVTKALEKEKDRRYQSANELASDIQRYLRVEPIVARPPSAIYQLRKFARRNKALVTGVTIAFVALIIGFIVATWQAVVAHHAQTEEAKQRVIADKKREEAERNEKIANSINYFWNRDVLAAVDPRRAANPNITMREVIDAAAEKIGDRFKDEPMVEASLRRTMGDTYRSLGLPDRALPHLEKARAMFVAQLGDEEPRSLGATNDLAILYVALGRFNDAEPLFIKGLEVRRKMFGPDNRDVLAATVNLGSLYRKNGRLEDARKMLSDCVPLMQKSLGKDDNDTVVAMQHLALTYRSMERWSDAEPLFRTVLATQTRTLGEDHPYTIVCIGALASVLEKLDQREEAESLYLRCVEFSTRRLGERHKDTGQALGNLGMFYSTIGQFDKAQANVTTGLEILADASGPNHPDTINMRSNLGTVLQRAGRIADAEPHFAAASKAARENVAETNSIRGQCILNYGVCLQQLGRPDEAEPLLLEALDLLRKTLGPSHEHTLRACSALALIYESRGETDKAAEFRARSQKPDIAK